MPPCAQLSGRLVRAATQRKRFPRARITFSVGVVQKLKEIIAAVYFILIGQLTIPMSLLGRDDETSRSNATANYEFFLASSQRRGRFTFDD